MSLLLQLQKLPGKGDGGWKKSVCFVFWLTRRLRARGIFWGVRSPNVSGNNVSRSCYKIPQNAFFPEIMIFWSAKKQ